MREQFIQKRFGADAMKMVQTINRILADYEAQGYDLSLRQLYYQLVSRNLVPNTERSYKNVGNLVSDARLAGLIDWDIITDRGRVMHKNPHWEDPSEFLESVAPQYRFNLWDDQETYVEVMVEKQALEGVLIPVCRQMDVPFTANKGYSSSSALYEASRRFMHAAQAGKKTYVIYLGDHDPSGIDMTRDVLDRLNLFVNVSMGRDSDDGSVAVRRVALNMDQIRVLNPPENPAKITDSRAKGYIDRFGESSWELDAIEPKALADLVTKAINSLMDKKKFTANRERMDAHRDELLTFAKKWRDQRP